MNPSPLRLTSFRSTLESLVTRRVYSEIRYFTDLHELLTARALIRRFLTTPGGEALELVSEEVILVARLVSASGVFSPEFNDYETCLACHCDL